MRTASIVVLLAAGSCSADVGMYGFTRSGDVFRINSITGARTALGSLGLDVVAAARIGLHPYVLTAADRLHTIDLHGVVSAGSIALRGRPTGFTTRAMQGNGNLLAILTDPSGRDWLYQIDPYAGMYLPIGPTGISDIRGFGSATYYAPTVITGYGQLYEIDSRTGAATYQTVIWPAGGPYQCLALDENGRAVAAGESLWTFDGGDPHTGWSVVQWRGYSDLVAMTDSDAGECYPECDTSTGPQALDIFDFLVFCNRFDAGLSYACNCDLSTGLMACDVFDFLCYQNEFAEGCN